ncbi:MAG: alcohol dehydrogenase catalytic domain-containing protein, partial [Methanothrix sp.]|nr:alcohol dehydrogenase catalytic domain-containing protein [Methanothrix sp.]
TPKGGALLKMKACAVCGTDIKMMQQGHRDLVYPQVPGHEMVGRIVETNGCGGSLAEGDLVQIWPGIACGIAEAMKEIGYKRAFVVHGRSRDASRGMDELSTLGRSYVAEMAEDGSIREYALMPQDLGIRAAEEAEILHRGGREKEALRLLRLLCGRERGSRRDIVCLNAAPLLCMAGHASSLKEAMEKAEDIIDSGRAMKKLHDWVKHQNQDPGPKLEQLQTMVEMACS